MSETYRHHAIEVKGYNTSEMAALYQVTATVFKRWIKPHQAAIGKREGHYYTVLQVKVIFEKLGTPCGVIDDD